jgi:hypothetical protein
VAEYLPRKFKSLNSIPQTAKNKINVEIQGNGQGVGGEFKKEDTYS